MTNVFVHFRTPDGELYNREMFFSRAPVAGEIVYVDNDSYEVIRVDHHPGRNNAPKDSRTAVSAGVPEDVEIWLVKKDASPCPI
ncbi:MAG: hypothetical protein R3F14_11780 [Polyangiaceae bacterium]